MRDITLEDTFLFNFSTRAFATGIPTTLAGTPVLSVKETGNDTVITAGVSVDIDTGSGVIVGFHEGTVVATAANGYENGKSYSVYISTGTVGGVSVVGELVHEFTIGLSAAVILLPTSLSAGRMRSDVLAINASTSAAIRHALAAAQMIPGTVDNTAHTPTDTEFEADDITEATADHFGGLVNNARLILWTTGALAGQIALITDYAIAAGRGHFTVQQMTEAPANDDTFITI